ncbi:plasmalemma vesicle-associated protein [Sceloporus undulatus]|uniref:plasmalemma vesicle-associated protein n=1 Tax=Sceloporus undulatus TaxID=8520 RepID=UPI001C4BF211|nr:plasmalemma vesicle-associated protein [Sceloporus undulatus]
MLVSTQRAPKPSRVRRAKTGTLGMMDAKNPYAMAKLSLEAKENLRPKRDCGFYVKYFFLFLSLIQFLIILGLVLFMVYGSPQMGNEKHLQGLTSLLQKAEGKAETLGKEAGELKRKLNASQAESGMFRKQAAMINVTLKSCMIEKAMLSEGQKNFMMYYHNSQECCYNLQMLNMTCPVKVTSLEEQLKALHLQSQLDRSKHAQEIQALQEKAKQVEKEKTDCQLEKLQVQTREQKYRALETKVMVELEPARQKLATEVDRVLAPKQLAGCYHSEVTNMKDVCLSLATNLQNELSTFARQLDQKVNEVAQENGRLQGQKESCAHELQERERQLGTQRQQAETEKQVLREMQATERKKMEAEQQKLAREKEDLKGQLEQSKQACLRTRNTMGNIPVRFPGFPSSGSTNPFASFPGGSPNTGVLSPGGAPAVPNTYGQPPPWPRPGQPSSGSQGTLSHADRTRQQEQRKNPLEVAKMPNQPPVGQPSG